MSLSERGNVLAPTMEKPGTGVQSRLNEACGQGSVSLLYLASLHLLHWLYSADDVFVVAGTGSHWQLHGYQDFQPSVPLEKSASLFEHP